MPVADVVAGAAAYLGGDYDPQSRKYSGRTTAMVGSVRRGKPREADDADYLGGAPGSQLTGAYVVVRCSRHHQRRVTVGPSAADLAAAGQVAATGGHLERIVYELEVHVWVRSTQPYAEDTADDVYAIEADLVRRLRADPTLGGAVFQAGEAVDGAGGGTGVEVQYGDVLVGSTQLSTSYFVITFAATEYLNA